VTSRIPIVLVVGFLGAGKTTFLRSVLPLLEKAGKRVRVLINDYQNARVDAAALQDQKRSVAAISGDCVCCSALHELRDVLVERQRGLDDLVLIEANGTTDPFPLIEYLSAEPDLRERYGPIIQVTLVDLLRWQKRAWHDELERMQILSASHFLLTREEKVPAPRLMEVRDQISETNPAAVEVSVESVADLLAGVPSTEDTPSESCAVSHDRHDLAHAYCSLEIELPDQIPSAKLLHWLRALPDEVLRVKGVAQLEEFPGLHFSFQRVAGEPGGPTMNPLPTVPTVPPVAILIGSHLDHEVLQRSLQKSLKEAVEAKD